MSNKKKRPAAPATTLKPSNDEPSADGSVGAGDDLEEGDVDTDEGDMPGVVVARLSELQTWIPASVTEGQPDRIAWFLAKADAELAGVFDRYPEGPLPAAVTKAILAGLREFSVDQSDRLQVYVGVTDAIEYGFHVDATLEQVVESFEDDGFDVFEAVEGGRVVVGVEEAPSGAS